MKAVWSSYYTNSQRVILCPEILPRKALISISSRSGAIYPNGHRTGLFSTEALQPCEVLTQAGFEVDLGTETSAYGLDGVSLTKPKL
jgi:hypothetical protein